MKLQTTFLLVCLFRTSFGLPLQIGILASNSNEILRLNGLTLATLGQTQASSIFPQYVLQQQQQLQQPEVLLTPQFVNFNPQFASPFGPQGPQMFLPSQGNQLTPVIVPNGQQDQLGPPQDPNTPVVPHQPQNPVQMFPQFQYPFYGFPQLPRQQGYPYFMSPYGYPQQRNTLVQPNNGQQTLERSTQRPQLPLQQGSQTKVQTDKTWPLTGTQKESTTNPPDPRGDTTGPGIDEGHSNFPFLFEP